MMYDRSWKWRRIAVGSTLIFNMIIIAYQTLYGTDTAIARDICQSAFLLFGTTLQGYMIGGIFDDKNKDKAMVAHAAVNQSSPSTTETKVDVSQ